MLCGRYNNYLSDEENLIEFKKQHIMTKAQLTETLDFVRSKTIDASKVDGRHSSSYYNNLIECIDAAKNSVEKEPFIENLSEEWFYYFIINSDGLKVYLSKFYKRGEEGHYCYYIKKDVVWIEVKAPKLTLKEYSEKYNIEIDTLKKQIRRGKFKSAKKIGDEWLIPEMVEASKANLECGKYYWCKSNVYFGEEYKFLNEGNYVEILQNKSNKSEYRIIVRKLYKIVEDIVMNTFEKEKFEMMLLNNPFVENYSGGFICMYNSHYDNLNHRIEDEYFKETVEIDTIGYTSDMVAATEKKLKERFSKNKDEKVRITKAGLSLVSEMGLDIPQDRIEIIDKKK